MAPSNISRIPLSDESIVVRGGNCSPRSLERSVCRHSDGTIGVSAVSASQSTFTDLCSKLPHSTVRAAVVGDIRRRGGDVILVPSIRACHALIVGWECLLPAPMAASEEERETVRLSGEANHRVFADFNNLDRYGRVRLNTNGTEEDLQQLGLTLSSGITVVLDDTEEFVAIAKVALSETGEWVGVVDWQHLNSQRS